MRLDVYKCVWMCVYGNLRVRKCINVYMCVFVGGVAYRCVSMYIYASMFVYLRIGDY